MAVRAEIRERIPLENVEIEYEQASTARRERRPRFRRARLLSLDEKGMELGSRESLRVGMKLALTIHLKGVRNYVRTEADVRSCTRVTILKQPAFAVDVQFSHLSDDQIKKLAWAREQLAPRRGTPPPPREEVRRGTASRREAGAEPPVTAQPTPPRMQPVPRRADVVKRPVALLKLIDHLDNFEVSNDLVLAIIEAAESGTDVEVLYPRKTGRKAQEPGPEEEEEGQRELEAALPSEGQAKPINVYRLARNTRLYFDESGLPVGPAAELIYVSRLKSPESCFAVELSLDTMRWQGAPSFNRGTILIFTTSDPVESGDFAFVRSRSGEEFAQVFFDKNDLVRLRRLNATYPERVMRRHEVHRLYKLVGHYSEL